MNWRYQLMFIGAKNKFIGQIKATFLFHLKELGIKEDRVVFIDEDNFHTHHKNNQPVFCLYFGNSNFVFKNADILQLLLKQATFILPVVEDIQKFKSSIPKELENINGFQLASSDNIEALISCVLEGLSLLRLSRRLFISYKRDESSTVAIQLFERLEKAGFDVFLDTHSIRQGTIFQEELWHRLADTDIVVLLNTPGFVNSEWTMEELAKANSMSIGILQLIWPAHIQEQEADISISLQLETKDFGNNIYNNSKSYLNEDIMNAIVENAESLRARSLAARQDNIISEFIASANKVAVKVNLQSEKYITLNRSNDNKELLIIPTVGVPHALTYNQSEELVARIKSKDVAAAYLLYDHRNLKEKWLTHLAWLEKYLPTKTIQLLNAEQWLQKN